MNKGFVCVILMLTVAPVVASATIQCLNYVQGGEEPNLLSIVGGALFGLISVPLWLTYIPALIIAPRFMKKSSVNKTIYSSNTKRAIVYSLLCGSFSGILIMTPVIFLSIMDFNLRWIMNWTVAGALSGSITLLLIVLIYRSQGTA